MRPIPAPMRAKLEQQPRMKRCALASAQDLYGMCSGRLTHPEWHHVWTYAGQQINEPWAIVGACSRHHEMVKSDRAVRMAFEAASLLLATEEDLAKYPRKNWKQIKKSLGIQ
ncbi:MAG: hypothetical protein KGI71_06000 [Patescibacteria group bacterium]|nr:hypothetical protein [Patescibacteria group bacterium]